MDSKWDKVQCSVFRVTCSECIPPTTDTQWKRGTSAKATKEAKKVTERLKLLRRRGMCGQAMAIQDRTATMLRYTCRFGVVV